jgi:hypothetical protein
MYGAIESLYWIDRTIAASQGVRSTSGKDQLSLRQFRLA